MAGKIIKNTGLDLEREIKEQSLEDWEFGSSSQSCITNIDPEARHQYLPKGEIQRGKEDFMDCASRAPLNLLESKLNWLYKNVLNEETKAWLKENEYLNDKEQIECSDAFIAILSKTTKNGNSLKAPLQAIHDFGLVPKKKLPAGPEMTWDEYHNPARITEELKTLGQEFNKIFTINYERVYEEDFEIILDKDMLDVAGYAWPFPDKTGVYRRVNKTPNHAFLCFNNPKYIIFDNYIDSYDDDFIKNLASDYDLLDYGYRVYISELNQIKKKDEKEEWAIDNGINPNDNWIVQILKALINLIQSIWKK